MKGRGVRLRKLQRADCANNTPVGVSQKPLKRSVPIDLWDPFKKRLLAYYLQNPIYFFSRLLLR
jgi:hypothetical protein